jgi:hypothetical protein
MQSLLSRVPTTNGQAAKKAAVRRAALNIYGGKTRPTLKALAYLGGFPVSRLYQARFRRKHNGGAHKHNGDTQAISNGKSVTVDEAVASWRVWTREQRAQFGQCAGVGDLWDHAIIPTIAEERPRQQAAK